MLVVLPFENSESYKTASL